MQKQSNLHLHLCQVQNFSVRNWEHNKTGINVKLELKDVNRGRLSGSHFPVNVEVSIIRMIQKVEKVSLKMFLEIIFIPLAAIMKLYFIFLSDFSGTALEQLPTSWGILWGLALWSISPGTSWMHRTANLVILGQRRNNSSPIWFANRMTPPGTPGGRQHCEIGQQSADKCCKK